MLLHLCVSCWGQITQRIAWEMGGLTEDDTRFVIVSELLKSGESLLDDEGVDLKVAHEIARDIVQALKDVRPGDDREASHSAALPQARGVSALSEGAEEGAEPDEREEG